MPFIVLFLAVGFIAIGLRGQAKAAGTLLASEFTGPDSFVQWFLAVMVIGLTGYIPKVKPVSDAMLVLILVVMVIAKGNPKSAGGGLFAKLEEAFQQTKATPARRPASFTQDAANAGVASIAQAITPITPPSLADPLPLEDIPGGITAAGIMAGQPL